MDLKEIGKESIDWIHLTQDANQWRDVVNTVTNVRVPHNLKLSNFAEQPVASQKGLCSM
jgi:hypothetical protein